MFWKLEPISNSLIWFLSSFSADQSSARTLNHRDFSPPRSLNMVAFLPFCLSNLRLRSEMNPQGVAWKSLSRPGAGLCHRCMHLRVPGLELWFLPDRIHNGESQEDTGHSLDNSQQCDTQVLVLWRERKLCPRSNLIKNRIKENL